MGEDWDAFFDDHDRGDGGDVCGGGDGLFGLSVEFGERDVFVLFRYLFEDGCELAAGAAPGGPEVDEDDVGRGDRLLEVLFGQCHCGHDGGNVGQGVFDSLVDESV